MFFSATSTQDKVTRKEAFFLPQGKKKNPSTKSVEENISSFSPLPSKAKQRLIFNFKDISPSGETWEWVRVEPKHFMIWSTWLGAAVLLCAVATLLSFLFSPQSS